MEIDIDDTGEVFVTGTDEEKAKQAVEVIKNIHLNNLNDQPDKSDILLFLPSIKEMTQIELSLIKDVGLKLIDDLNLAWNPVH